MDIQTATVIVFSPTGATQKIVNSIVKGMGIAQSAKIDLASQTIRECPPPVVEGDLVVIGVPVYAMGIPAILIPFLKKLKGQNKPVVLVAVYGNISDGVTLNELRLIAEASGFHVAGAGAFIGEHSYSTKRSPVAAGRPNNGDLQKAEEFGKMVIDKLHKLNDINSVALNIPECNKIQLFLKMSLPFNMAKAFAKGPTVDRDICTHCGLCARLCPVDAIDSSTLKVQNGKCLRCSACVKRCPQHARKMVFRMNIPVPRFLTVKSKTQKEPRVYL
jgi:ferredoxin/flavodoxin